MTKKYILIICISLSAVIITAVIAIVINLNFRVKKVEIEKNFEINKAKVLEYLEIKPDKLIFFYNTEKMEEKLSKHTYLSYFKITKIFPDKIKIELRIKDPVLKIIGKEGNIFYIDDKEYIYQRFGIPFNIPLLIYNNAKIQQGMKLNDNLRNILANLNNLRKKSKNIYDGINQIEIIEKSEFICEYVVNYRTNNNKFYLKNILNVDLLKEGFVSSLYLNETGITDRNLYYNGNGFVY